MASLDAPLESGLWYRVAELRPRLVARARLHRHRYRGGVWYLLQDPASGRVHRFTPAARLVIAAMDGQRSVRELWEITSDKLGDDAPTQDELIQLLGQLHSADLLATDVPPDALELFDRSQREARAKRRRSWVNPMAIRIPLWDPGRWLDRHAGLWRRLWSRGAGLLWLAVVLPALLMLPAHWGELSGNLSDRVLQADNLLLMALVFPLIKLLHELGHATATRAAGGEVHDMGVMLLVLMPVPYVDASAANVLRSRWQRALIGAAGMVVELFVAALAFYAWLLLEPGLARAVCFNIVFVAGLSTLVFNGNPLLRYDAYYVLADLAELPNLAAQSARYWGYLLQRYLFRLRDVESPAHTRSERLWFGIYGLASALYRLFVALAIALFIGSRFFFVGVLLALWAVAMMTVVPLFKAAKALTAQPEVRERRSRVLATALGSAAVLVLLVAVLPLPNRTVAQGIVWLPEQSIVRAAAPGFFRSFEAEPGSLVEPGRVLARSIDPALDAERRLLTARVRELEATYAIEFVADRARAEIAREQLQLAQTTLQRAEQRAQGLQMVAGAPGRFTVPRASDMPGRHLRQGDVLGYVLGDAPPVVRVVLDQGTVDVVASSTLDVQVRRASVTGQVLPGRVLRQVPAGRDEVPSQALTPSGGGSIAVDPRDPKGLRTLDRVFQLDVGVDSLTGQTLRYGERVQVRFTHEPAPLAAQLWPVLRRLFLRHFDV
ncbi:site-2 protease family protein [Roseateles sp. LYH14W]|uniref:Site-2 protease family protein n=1 Tax=Pelomonas parva TaxID=3299032 RepID=A0ABW7EY54_9BURK